MKAKLALFLQALAALALGLGIYLIFREGTWLHRYIPTSGALARVQFPGCGFVRFHLCDLLWGYGLCCVLCTLLPELPGAALAFGFGCLWELLQKAGIAAGTGDLLDCMVYLTGALAAVIINYRKRGNCMKRTVTALLCVAVILVFGFFALASSDEKSTQDQGKDSAQTQENESNLGDYTVEIVSCRLARTYDDEAAVIVKYLFANNSDDKANFMFAFDEEVYQNGVGLNTAFMMDDSANFSTDNQTKDIKPGAQLEVEVAYVLNDETTDIEVEVSELVSFNDNVVTKTFSITQ